MAYYPAQSLLQHDAAAISPTCPERKPDGRRTRLGYDIEIKVRPAKAQIGHLMLAVA